MLLFWLVSTFNNVPFNFKLPTASQFETHIVFFLYSRFYILDATIITRFFKVNVLCFFLYCYNVEFCVSFCSAY